MSAICGIVEPSGRAPDFDELKKMGRGMTFRCGGESAAYLSGGIGIFKSGDRPPFIARRGDRVYAVALDGRLENISSVCGDTGLLGGLCDEEILLEAYLSDGLELFKFLEGRFAFCLWDGLSGRLVLSRDAYGEKPLFWTRVGGGFYFASEIKGLLSLPCVDRSVSASALGHYLLSGEGDDRLYVHVNELKAGGCIVFDGFGVRGFELSDMRVESYREYSYSGAVSSSGAGAVDTAKLLRGLVTAYDRPSFDIAIPALVEEIIRNKKSAVPLWDDASAQEKKYFYERAERLRVLLGSGYDIFSSEKKRRSSSSRELERELTRLFERLCRENVGNIGGTLSRLDPSLLRMVVSERDAPRRIAARAMLCQLAFWGESLPLVLVP